MKKQMTLFMAGGVAAVLLSLVALPTQALEIQLPPDSTAFKPSTMPGYTLVLRNCTACHSAQYIQTQPASSHAWWEGEVKKMKATYGAQIPDADMPAMAEYLYATYGSGKGSDEANAPKTAAKPK
ncbi:cytochrome c [Paralcaligenes sp. KSB-10]|uniref:SorB family sulfite dehydrogenase c-type cytochrome subunit n=1 Tax=Paralcaligenes sp. KSB-10 TaxID=2901142 RepID=UPI001E4C84D8|nr:cytochrome c [Paralcaligenes sp. KSB-10]UHL63579.1 cytochrome c [Paralcaligenes sp. KSB-10]